MRPPPAERPPPRPKVRALLKKIRTRVEAEVWDGELGKLVEQLACLCFASLKGRTSLKAIQTAGPQHDLLVSGENVYWLSLLEYLHFKDASARTIVVECKGTEGKAEDHVAQRLASVLANYLDTTGALGVVFSLAGATGEPQPGKPRQRSLRDSRLTRTLFFARTKKPIVVIDWQAMTTLAEPGSLPQLLEQGIQDLEAMPGIRIGAGSGFVQVDLPDHLKIVLSPKSVPKKAAAGDRTKPRRTRRR